MLTKKQRSVILAAFYAKYPEGANSSDFPPKPKKTEKTANKKIKQRGRKGKHKKANQQPNLVDDFDSKVALFSQHVINDDTLKPELAEMLNNYNQLSELHEAAHFLININMTIAIFHLFSKGETLSYGHKLLFGAIANDDIDFANKCLMADQALKNATNSSGQTLLGIACEKNSEKCVTLLLKNEAEINTCDNDGKSALHYCVLNNNIKLTEALIKAGADVHIQGFSQKQQERTGSPLVSALYQGANTNNFELANIMIKSNSDYPHNNANNYSHGPLFLTLSRYFLAPEKEKLTAARVVEFLLTSEFPIDVNEEFTTDIKNNSRFFQAPSKSDYFTIFFAAKLGDQTNPPDLTPIDIQLIKLLKKKGYNAENHYINDEFSVKEHLFIKLFEYRRFAPTSEKKGPGLITLQKICKVLDVDTENEMHTRKICFEGPEIYLCLPKNTNMEECDIIIEAAQKMVAIQDEAEEKAKAKQDISKPKPSERSKISDNDSIKKHTELTNEILDCVKKFKTLVEEHSKSHISTFIRKLTIETLDKLSITTLDNIKSQVAQLLETTKQRLQNLKNQNQKVIESSKTQPTTPVKPTAIYEGGLAFSSQLMVKIENYEAFLLLPFNSEGKRNLDHIPNTKSLGNINEDKFNKIITTPRVNEQTGIKFLNPSPGEYDILLHTDNGDETIIRDIVAEIKVTNSPERLGLYRLTKQGEGPTVYAIGSFLPKGFHEKSSHGRQKGADLFFTTQAISAAIDKAEIREPSQTPHSP